MAIFKKTGIFYEILIRGNDDPAKGNLGDFRGAYLIEASALVDDETNEMHKLDIGQPREVSKDELSKYFGPKLANFDTQYKKLVKELSEKNNSLAEAIDKISTLESRLLSSKPITVDSEKVLDKV